MELVMSRLRDKSSRVQATVSFEIPSEVTNLTIHTPPGTTITGNLGFQTRGGQQLVWKQSTSQPQLDLEISVGSQQLGAAGTTTVDMGDWAIVEAPNLAVQWQSYGSDISLKRKVVVGDRGVTSTDASLVYLGPYLEHTREAAGQRIRLIEPREASLRETPREILDALEFAAKELPLGGLDDEVIAIAAPTRPVNWGPGGVHTGGNAFWARDSARLDKSNSTWVHEYVHTRQDFSVDPTMKWFIEATAVYYATRSVYQEGRISDGAYHSALTPSRCENEVLGAPQQWSTAHVPYQKGSRVATWLDSQVRDRNGKTLAVVLRTMNRVSDGNVTDPSSIVGFLDDGEAVGYDEFKRIIADVITGGQRSGLSQQFEDTLNEFVTSSRVPDETPPPGLDEIPEGPLPETGMPTDVTELLEEAFGEQFGEDLLDGDGRIDEGIMFGGDEPEKGLIDGDDVFETEFETEDGKISIRGVTRRFDSLEEEHH